MRIQNESLNIKIVGGSVVKGDKGDPGLQGIQGIPGINGRDGKDGRDGVDGRDGIDGKDGRGIKSISLIDTKDKIKTYRIEYTDGTYFDFEIKDGEDGTDGKGGMSGGAILRGAEKTSRKTNDYNSTSEVTYPSSKALSNAVASLKKQIEGMESLSIVRVDNLPTEGKSSTLYLVPSENDESKNIYDEYIWVNKCNEQYEWEKIGSTEITVKDVQANGTSIVTDGVANIPMATSSTPGLVRPVNANGIYVSNTGTLNLSKLSDASLPNKNANYAVLISQIDLATKVGVTTNTITLTDEEKANACNWVGAGQQRTVVEDSTTPTVKIENALSNTDYQYGTITSLTITAVETSYLETNFYFTAGDEITVDLPDTLKIIGNPSFEPNKQYAMSICNNTLIVGIIS